ncbi:Acetolactate synthase large subunit [Klenkia marina]|uniref:Acetolactate synthase large subunit n=1 Tax=Klenkia marina TaxID=1960309 RepID=A0A1G4YHN8_9ACTN|nr:thiamine pyrophosphate-binding protein [Klenkia marina]SCX52854.1 Acetolactate synthase large subunit [Klenkia marina]
MRVAEAIGRALAAEGVRQVFGVVGSGNFHLTNALVDAGAAFVAARHEAGATTMADGWARSTDEVGVVTVHQGCGFTNTLTGLTEAAKSRTPLLVLAAAVVDPRANFFVDQPALARAVGAESRTATSADTAVAQAVAAYRLARDERRAVVLDLPLDVQAADAPADVQVPAPVAVPVPEPTAEAATALAAALQAARRPVFVAGRGARGPDARDALRALAARCGALLATSAVARGLFVGDPWSLDVSGGFATDLAAELIGQADLVVGWGCALNGWTTRHGRLLHPDAVLAQVDVELEAIGRHRPVDVGVLGDVAATAAAVGELVGPARTGWRTDAVGARIAAEGRWADVATPDTSTADRIDPRVLSRELDSLLPAERVVAVDSGNFMGYPSMYLSVPDERGFCFTQAFQSVGLGLATAIGAAVAQPHRLPVAALGDGGALMGASELETVVRLGLGMLVVVYDDAAYGAEVHHFGPDGYDVGLARFPDADLAAWARGLGFGAVTVRTAADLAPVAEWLAGPRDRPFLVDAKVVDAAPSWWLEEAFRSH